MASLGPIPFDEASRRLRVSGRAYRGIPEIPVARIVGSVDRSDDFGRDFGPRRRLSRSRPASLRSVFPEGDMPAIDFDAAAAHARELKLPRSRKRHHLREANRPLPRRDG
jgi:hypothetical protein